MTILKPKQQNKRKVPRIYGLDCETYGKKNHFYCCSIYGEDGNYCKTFYSQEETIKALMTDKRFRSSWLTMTNMEFDFFSIFAKYENGKNVYHDELANMKPITRKGTYIGFVWQLPNKKKMTLIGTENYIKNSVEQLGNILNIPKMKKPKCLGEIPSEKEHDYFIKYNIRDAEISYLITKFLLKTFHKLGADCKVTIASTAMTLWRNKYQKKAFFQPDPEDLKFLLKGYYGGRTEAFKRGKIKDYGYYDFNSLYPSRMLKDLPDPNSMRKTKRSSVELIQKHEGVSKVAVYCRKDMKIPILPYRLEDGKLIFPVGTFCGYYPHNELRYALENGYKILDIYETYYFIHKCNPFKEYSIDMYNLRCKYKKEGNVGMATSVKLLMNSLYGKFGQKFDEKIEMIHQDGVDDLNKYDRVERMECFLRCVTLDCKPASFCIPIFSLYITAMGRIHLHKALKDSDPVYCDTDSIITQKDLGDSKILGELKLENTIKDGIIIKPKMYSLNDEFGKSHTKLKGVSQKCVFNLRDLAQDPEIVMEKWTKIREALRSIQGLSVNEKRDVIKTISLEDTKRNWNGELFSFDKLQDSKPIELNLIDIFH